jgi:hypothetical protein
MAADLQPRTARLLTSCSADDRFPIAPLLTAHAPAIFDFHLDYTGQSWKWATE